MGKYSRRGIVFWEFWLFEKQTTKEQKPKSAIIVVLGFFLWQRKGTQLRVVFKTKVRFVGISDYKAPTVAALTSNGIQVVIMAPRATLHLCSAFSSQGLPWLQALISAPWVPGVRATVRCCRTKGWAGRKERGWDEVTEINGWYFNLLFFFFFSLSP